MFNTQPQATLKSNIRTIFTSFLRCIIVLWMILAQQAYAAKNPPTLLVLGDSLSAAYGIPWESGWVQQLEKQYSTKWNVINASISGDTTAGGLARLPGLLSEHSPTLVIIELGGNDGLRGYPLKTIEDNIKKMIELSQAQQVKVVLTGMEIPPNYGKRYTESFANIFVNLSKSHNTLLIPFLLDKIATNTELMQGDRIHPTEAAQKQMLENVLSALKPFLDNPHFSTSSK